MYTRLFTGAVAVLLLLSASTTKAQTEWSPECQWEYEQVLTLLKDNYHDPKAVAELPWTYVGADETDCIDKINAVVNKLGNPWTHYYSPDYVSQPIPPDRRYSQMSVRATAGDHPLVSHVMFKGPAEKAGILRGDRLLAVNGKSLKGLGEEEVQRELRGTAGQRLDIEYSRGGTTKFHTWLVFADEEPLVEARLCSGGIAYFHIRDFTGSDMPKEFAAKFAEIYTAAGGQLKGIVLDLRGNPGGYMVYAYSLLSAFIKEGKIGVMTHRSGKTERYATPYVVAALVEKGFKAGTARKMQQALYDLPLVALTNRNTCSAAEATTAGLQDCKRATIIGETTWGKGMHFCTHVLESGSMLSIVGGKFTGPKGTDHHEVGIAPDTAVTDDRQFNRDVPLETALTFLRTPGSVAPPEPPGSRFWVFWFMGTGLCVCVIVGILWRRHRRQCDERRMQRLLRVIALRECPMDETHYLDDGSVDWAAISCPRPRDRRRSVKPALVIQLELQHGHFFDGAPCHHCGCTMHGGEQVAEVLDGSESYFCCAACGEHVTESGELAAPTAA